MISLLETILWVLVIIVVTAGAIYLTFCILYWQAKEIAEKSLVEREAKLSDNIKELEAADSRLKACGDEKYAELMIIKKETDIKKQQAEEILSKAEKITEENKIKMDKLIQERDKAIAALSGARHRAHRIAKRTALQDN